MLVLKEINTSSVFSSSKGTIFQAVYLFSYFYEEGMVFLCRYDAFLKRMMELRNDYNGFSKNSVIIFLSILGNPPIFNKNTYNGPVSACILSRDGATIDGVCIGN